MKTKPTVKPIDPRPVDVAAIQATRTITALNR